MTYALSLLSLALLLAYGHQRRRRQQAERAQRLAELNLYSQQQRADHCREQVKKLLRQLPTNQ
ncbi:hypothetical protein [Hymenobacter latericus]|uniref:hypothetical protein n=1 Tax=Hymenobacter sp. YIM 151858-1 TaxID=2987688 RepID=UPI002227BC43|nr:hypothetical protein [Hymenobacter sp. YIM 151858-1]UYZ60084.1 hypothetical protein OIS50_04610 [Hymenobacter sp. YIM 151858-1]